MTRKAKIGWMMGGIAVVAAAIGFFFEKDEGELRVIYIGLSPTNSQLIEFALTNTSSKTFIYIPGYAAADFRDSFGVVYDISGQTNQVIEYPMCSDGIWKTAIHYGRPRTGTFRGRVFKKAALFADRRGWKRIKEWLLPDPTWRYAYGPQMLGNKPLAEAQK